MATRQGRRYGAERGTQRNKEDEPGQNRPNRSPGQSNANSSLPSLREDVGASQRRDTERIGRGMNPTGSSALTRTAQQQAGGRAINRTAVRGGLVGLAASLGPAAKELGDMYVNKVTNDLKSNRVELSSESKSRIAAGELDRKPSSSKVSSDSKPSAPKRSKEVSYDNGGVREGQHEGISDSTRGDALEDVNKHKWKGVMDDY